MREHTPGPWHANALLRDWIGDSRGRLVASVTNGYTPSVRLDRTGGNIEGAEAEANARLIATAPELLAALVAVTEHMDRAGGDRDGMPECPWCKRGPENDGEHMGDCELLIARAAIAKAKGEPESVTPEEAK